MKFRVWAKVPTQIFTNFSMLICIAAHFESYFYARYIMLRYWKQQNKSFFACKISLKYCIYCTVQI